MPATLLKKRLPTQMFPCEYCEIFKNSFFYRTPRVAASAQWKHNTFFTLLLFIYVWRHFQLKAWNQEGREITKNLFWNLFVPTLEKFLETCWRGFISFLLQAWNVDKIDKNSPIPIFPRFCYNSKQLFWNYQKHQEHLLTRMSQNGCFYKVKKHKVKYT